MVTEQRALAEATVQLVGEQRDREEKSSSASGSPWRSELEVRLGDPLDVALKLAVAARVIPLLAAGTPYLDVAVRRRLPLACKDGPLRSAAARNGIAVAP